MKILLRAPLLTTSGYGVHSRQFFEWLEEKDVELKVECLNWGMTPWMVNPEKEGGLVGRIMSKSKQLKPPYDVSVQVQLPDEWDTKLGKKNIGVSAFVETDKCSQKWIEKCNEMDHIIVPSTFTKNVVRRSGVLTTPISVVPEWFNHDVLNKERSIEILEKDDRFNFSTDFNFLMISQLTAQTADADRKNIFNTIAWLCERFRDNPNVGIVLKTNMGKGTTIDRNITKNVMKQIVSAVGKGPFPKIHLIHGNMEPEEIAALYHHPKIKCFVSATRGEGYGLPIIDAAAAGMPIIATNWSGHLEFLETGSFLPVEYDMKDIHKSKVDNRIFYEGFRWAEPRKESFITQVDRLMKNHEVLKKNAEKYSEIVSEKYHKTQIKKMYDKILIEVLK